MTIPEFLDKLRVTEGPWTLTEEGYIRCGKLCPLERVANTSHFTAYRAGYLLDMKLADIDAIVGTADERWKHVPELNVLRRQLLAATVERP